MDNKQKLQIQSSCYKMKLKALDMAFSTGSHGAHIGGAFSSMEIFAVLYNIANIGDMNDPQRDRVIVSKGHCVLSYYTALWQKGMITDEMLDTFDKNGTRFHGHPHRNLECGIEFSSGSLGLGASYAVGVALACKQKNIKNHIYVVLGDGECDEGIVWEALMSASNYGLDNLVLIVDKNGYQLDGPTNEVMNTFSLKEKFHAFGFDVDEVDGHSIDELYKVIVKDANGPRAIIANTVKANGISFLINNKMSHQCALSSKKYRQALDELKHAYDGKF